MNPAVIPDDHAVREYLAREALIRISEMCDAENWGRFRSSLRRPSFALIDSTTVLARWVPGERRIEVSLALVFDHDWAVVFEVLLHEMAHQYVGEVLFVRDETDHGEIFQKVCSQFGIDGRASGVPSPVDDPGRASVLDKIRKLLALATSPNPHEAESAMNAARRLMLKHNIERVERDRSQGHHWRHVGKPLKRIELHRSKAANLLEEHFFVKVIWVTVWDVMTASSRQRLEVCGTAANVEFAEYVYSFLVHTAEAMWDIERRKGRFAHGRVSRRSYLSGVTEGFRAKLAAESARDKEAGLVWVADPALAEYYRARHPRIVTTRRSGGRYDPDAHSVGHDVGGKLVLRAAVDSGVTERGRQLASGRDGGTR